MASQSVFQAPRESRGEKRERVRAQPDAQHFSSCHCAVPAAGMDELFDQANVLPYWVAKRQFAVKA